MEDTNIEEFKAMETQGNPTVFSGPITIPDQSTLQGFFSKFSALITGVSGDFKVGGALNVVSGYKTNGTSGVSGTITLAKITSLGSPGSITFTNGLITSYSNPT